MILTNATITAYCLCLHCCPASSKGLAANGRPPIAGITVAASRSIPLGTHLRVEGLTNDFIVGDRLARRYDNRIDIFMNSHKAALKWGKQQRKVTIQ